MIERYSKTSRTIRLLRSLHYGDDQNICAQTPLHTIADVGAGCREGLKRALLYRISAMQLKSAVTVETKTFNNQLGFERGLWHHQARRFVVALKRGFSGAFKLWNSQRARLSGRHHIARLRSPQEYPD